MESKPEIYGDCMDDMEFLTEHEKSYLHMGQEPLKKMLLQRAKMFCIMFRSFKEFDKKTETFKLIDRAEWKMKILPILNLQFKLTNEQAKGIIDLFWQRVSIPKGGIKKGVIK